MITTILAHPASAPAIRTPAAVVTYGELATRITVLAHRLAARGLGPERVCALAVPRGVDAVVAMAAVLHTGAAFLSLDVEAPPARLSAMATSAEAEFLLTTTGVTLDLALPRLDLDTPDPAWAPLPPVRPNALAYVSHTSGSTGTPNAVQIERRSLESYLDFLVADYGLGPHTTCLQLAPQGYDASIRDTLAPLVAGGQLVLVPRSALLRPKEFAEVLTTHGVNTILSTTPSFLTAMSEVDLSRLSLVVSSGESLRPFLAAGGRGRVGGTLVNQYGPTECTMTTTRYRVPHNPDLSADRIGTPIDGAEIHLLDPRGDEVPDGTPGEIHIGGVGVARGYANNPELTATRFHPTTNTRLYRTGDQARRLPDGTLEYLGRLDRQVKIRGYRVDPGEVEAALLRHPAITGAVVTAPVDDRGRVHLVAHITGGENTPDPALRAHLAESLPPHLMPRRFSRLAELPRTPTGKADRKLLTGEAATAPLTAAVLGSTPPAASPEPVR